MNVHLDLKIMARSTDTKTAIEQAALRLFVERGIAETSIKQVARAAKVSQGAMYNHYVSKDELAWQLFARNFSEIGHALRHRAQEHRGLEAQFRAMVRYVFERLDEDWLLVTYVFSARHHHLRRVDRRMGNPYLAFRNVISRAMKRRQIPRQDLDLAASLVTGAIIQVIDTRILGRIAGGLPEQADRVARALVGLLGAGP
jgi:AcrR family transcriptional regulator